MLTTLEQTKKISLGSFVINILHFLKREDEDIKIILHSVTEGRTLFMEDFSEKNPIIEKQAWENIILWLENKRQNFSLGPGGKMNGAIAEKKDFNKIGCSIYGLPNFRENVFSSIKILEFYTQIKFEEILKNLEASGAPLEKKELLEMNNDFTNWFNKS